MRFRARPALRGTDLLPHCQCWERDSQRKWMLKPWYKPCQALSHLHSWTKSNLDVSGQYVHSRDIMRLIPDNYTNRSFGNGFDLYYCPFTPLSVFWDTPEDVSWTDIPFRPHCPFNGMGTAVVWMRIRAFIHKLQNSQTLDPFPFQYYNKSTCKILIRSQNLPQQY